MKFHPSTIYTLIFLISNTYASNPVSKYEVLEDSCDNIMVNYNDALTCDQTCRNNYKQKYSHCFPGVIKAIGDIPHIYFPHIIANSYAVRNRFSSKGPVSSKKDKKSKRYTTGMSSGNENTEWNIWGSLNRNNIEQDFDATSTKKLTGVDNRIFTTVAGGDYTLSSNMVVGLSVSLNNGDGSISYLNDTKSLVSENMDGSNYSIAPYFGMQLSPELTLDVSLGFGRGKLDIFRDTENKSHGWFGGANLSYTEWMDNIQLTSKFTYMHGEETYKDSITTGKTNPETASTNKLDQVRLGGQVGYWLDGFMPYVSLAYSSDISRKSSQSNIFDNTIGKNAWIWGLGVDFFSLSNDITGGLSFTKEEGRDHQDNNTIAGNISMRF